MKNSLDSKMFSFFIVRSYYLLHLVQVQRWWSSINYQTRRVDDPFHAATEYLAILKSVILYAIYVLLFTFIAIEECFEQLYYFEHVRFKFFWVPIFFQVLIIYYLQ